MTETQWLECMDVNLLLTYLTRDPNQFDLRKLRLFVCACCRRMWDQLDPQLRQAVESAELFADGKLSRAKLAEARRAARGAEQLPGRKRPVGGAVWAVYDGGVAPVGWVPAGAQACVEAVSESARHVGAWAAERTAQAALLHDLFGNPFRPVVVAPIWLTWHDGLVARMARDVYEHRRFVEMPVLGDALEDAGCDNRDILSHCRGNTEHARGCWLLDGLLGPG